ncbi:hypothetical protein [Priestia megaterium]|uniref:hypothetical protein n=1 Tax=Priestia megaterium TaxID=1404 RepID=UPI000BFD2C02|nr:hypothetical protein [Priestia megaterium]PGO60559.1 hypothetical protein CN981_08390 [Priestia megaterium]
MSLAQAEYRRLAGRTYEEFEKDILEGHAIEREIIERYCQWHEDIYESRPKVVDNGVDNSGKFLDITEVNKSVDFIVDGVPTEVKFIREDLFSFRLKLNLIKSYIEQKAVILLVNGWDTTTPKFTILKLDDLEHISIFSKRSVSRDWEGKPTVKIYRNSYNWNALPPLKKH